MNSKTLLLLIFLVAAAGLVALALKDECIQASVTEISTEWDNSGHADADAEAWVHWDEDDPAEVPAGCAACHSLQGYLDLLGEDGSPAGSVEHSASTGSVLYCHGCHNDSAHALTSVTFPSGEEVSGLGHEATCMQCHQGRTSGADVEAAVESMDEDRAAEDLTFINIHYFAAGATRMGAEAGSGYEYDGSSYAQRFGHTADYDACYECHNPHSLELDPMDCSPCHSNVAAASDMSGIKQGEADYDGDGNVMEGVAAEIDGLKRALLQAIQSYARSVSGVPVGYDNEVYPYFFVDTNGDGALSADEAVFTNRYNGFTPRLLKATYNYQAVNKDPGAFAHNPTYVIQLLHDSLKSLGEKVQVDMSGMVRP